MYSVQCTLYTLQCTLHNVHPYTLNGSIPNVQQSVVCYWLTYRMLYPVLLLVTTDTISAYAKTAIICSLVPTHSLRIAVRGVRGVRGVRSVRSVRGVRVVRGACGANVCARALSGVEMRVRMRVGLVTRAFVCFLVCISMTNSSRTQKFPTHRLYIGLGAREYYALENDYQLKLPNFKLFYLNSIPVLKSV